MQSRRRGLGVLLLLLVGAADPSRKRPGPLATCTLAGKGEDKRETKVRY